MNRVSKLLWDNNAPLATNPHAVNALFHALDLDKGTRGMVLSTKASLLFALHAPRFGFESQCNTACGHRNGFWQAFSGPSRTGTKSGQADVEPTCGRHNDYCNSVAFVVNENLAVHH